MSSLRLRGSGDAFWRVGLELDPPRQLRRARRALAGTTVEQELRAAVGGKVVLITGASAGIGRETARRVARAGGEVLLVARRAERLEALADELRMDGGIAHVLPCDLSDMDAVDALAARALVEHGGVDVLVNNAGRSIRRPFDEQGLRGDTERVMHLNYHGVVRLTLPLVERMRQAGGGHVVNVSTIGTQVGPVPRFAGYVASKSALDAFTRAAAAETIGDGMLWTSVHMPLARTEMIAPSKRWDDFPAMTVEQAGDMMVDALVRRPVHVSHPWALMTRAIDLAAPRFVERRWGRAIGQAVRHSAGRTGARAGA